MQKCAHLVELEKCCQTHTSIYLAKIGFDTAENEPAQKLQKNYGILQNLLNLPDRAPPPVPVPAPSLSASGTHFKFQVLHRLYFPDIYAD